MYAARRRGRSVFRADPHHRQRTYEQVSWEMMGDGMVEREEVDGGMIVGDASDEHWEEGTTRMAVPSSFEDGFGVYDEDANHEHTWW
jgi:hypothetical protein